jgi:hypothetical protein
MNLSDGKWRAALISIQFRVRLWWRLKGQEVVSKFGLMIGGLFAYRPWGVIKIVNMRMSGETFNIKVPSGATMGTPQWEGELSRSFR